MALGGVLMSDLPTSVTDTGLIPSGLGNLKGPAILPLSTGRRPDLCGFGAPLLPAFPAFLNLCHLGKKEKLHNSVDIFMNNSRV